MSFDSTGLTVKDAATILDEMNDEVLTNLRSLTGDPDLVIDTSDVSPIGKLNKIFSTRLANIWTSAQDIEDAMRADKAVGASLEKLALLVGFLRNPSTFTKGDLRFTGDDGTIVPAGSIFANVQGDEFTNEGEFTISLESCFQFNTRAGVIRDSRTYSVTIGGITVPVTSGASATNQSILTLLRDAINLNTEIGVTATLLSEGTEDEDYFLQIVNDDQTVTMNASVSPLLVTDSVDVEYLVTSSVGGVVFGDADTVNTIITSLNGLDSVNNQDDFILGTVGETDAQLRERIDTDYNVTGSGTLSNIQALFQKNDNVRSAFVEENRSYTTNADGIPAKAYEVILSFEGDSQSMADLIWETKPTGLETFGDSSFTVKDASGTDQTVYFSEAVDKFAYFRITATTLPASEGEVLPANHETLIANACVVEGDTYEINQDLIGKRFYGIIYNAVDGLDELDVEVFLSPTIIPDPNTITGWADVESVGRKEIATFGTENRFVFNIT